MKDRDQILLEKMYININESFSDIENQIIDILNQDEERNIPYDQFEKVIYNVLKNVYGSHVIDSFADKLKEDNKGHSEKYPNVFKS
jgi:hypothetical protein